MMESATIHDVDDAHDPHIINQEINRDEFNQGVMHDDEISQVIIEQEIQHEIKQEIHHDGIQQEINFGVKSIHETNKNEDVNDNDNDNDNKEEIKQESTTRENEETQEIKQKEKVDPQSMGRQCMVWGRVEDCSPARLLVSAGPDNVVHSLKFVSQVFIEEILIIYILYSLKLEML